MLNIEHVNYKYDIKSENDDIRNINLKVDKGECILLCGRSGSGKTTVMKLINSLIPNFYEAGELSGKVTLNGIDTQKSQIFHVSRVVSSVFQNPKTQFFNVNTTSEILFYLENLGYDREYMKQKLIETSELFSIGNLLDRDIFQLSGGEKQIIAIAGAYASGTDIILLDEPSSNLDQQNTNRIGEILKKIKEAGKTIIISEHRFYYIKNIIDRVYYIDEGEIKKEFTKEEFFNLDQQLRIKLGLRTLNFESLICSKKAKPKNRKSILIEKIHHNFKGQNRALVMENKTFYYGSIYGIYGYNGIGKSTFIKILMGLEKTKSKILINGEISSAKKRLNKSFLVMQDVNHQLFTDSVKTEVTLGKSDKFSDSDVNSVLEKLRLLDIADKHPMSLSGGQKQRVAIASAILSKAEIICFDEPTSGMDFESMIRISELIKETIQNDKIIFIISHDNEFLNRTADQVFTPE